MTKINAVIIESDEHQYSRVDESFKRIFAGLNWEFVAQFAENQRAARGIISSQSGLSDITVVVSDITMGNEENRGLIWIQGLKKSFPDIFLIGVSGSDVTYTATSAKNPNFDIFIHKQALHTPSDDDMFAKQQIKKLFKRNTILSINSNSQIPTKSEIPGRPVFKNGIRDRELNSLLSQVFLQGDNGEPVTVFDDITLTPMIGGFSTSSVFRANLKNSNNGISGIPCVLKISSKVNAEIEAENYRKYVKWTLPYDWRVELLGEGYTNNYGAICYSFVRSGLVSFKSASDRIKAKDDDATKRILETIFSDQYQTWYDKKLRLKSEESIDKNLSDHYVEKLFPGDHKTRASQIFKELAQRYCGAVVINDYNIEIEIDEQKTSIREPSHFLFSYGDKSFLTTISHGDLNSNNILISNDEAITFIDFQSTGRQHVFIDFVTFEHSIRMYYPGSNFTVTEMIKYEGLISNEAYLKDEKELDIDIPSMYQLLFEVRKNAIRNFPEEPFQNFIYGATVFSLRFLRITDFTSDQYQRMICQIFSGMSHLVR